MNWNAWFGGAALMTVLVGCWKHIQIWLNRLASHVVIKVKMDSALSEIANMYAWDHWKRSPFGPISAGCTTAFINKLNRNHMIAFQKNSGEPILFWDGWKPVLITGFSAHQAEGSASLQPGSLLFFRGTFDVDVLLIEIAEHYNDKIEQPSQDKTKQDRFFVTHYTGKEYSHRNDGGPPTAPTSKGLEVASSRSDFLDVRLLKWTKADIGCRKAGASALADLYYPDDVQEIIREVRIWKESEAWYRNKHIPWRRGCCLYGKPGTGKTSLVRAVGMDLDMPIFVMDLATLSNNSFMDAWKNAMHAAPSIVLLEDLHAVYSGREPVTKTERGYSYVQFDCLLNTISGISNSDGVFLFITTNDITTLDPALGSESNGINEVSRPGRIDRCIELGPLTAEGRLKMAQRILSDCPGMVHGLVADGEGDTGAQFMERCARYALSVYWNRTHITEGKL